MFNIIFTFLSDLHIRFFLSLPPNQFAGELKGDFADNKPESHPENWQVKVMYPILYYFVGASFGPFRGREDMERLQAMERNAVENETFFLALAVIWPNVPVELPDWAPAALLAFTYFRFIHFAFYCFIKIQPWRAIAWTLSTVALNVMAINILVSLSNKNADKSSEL